MFCRAVLEGDTKSNSHTASSQPAMSEDDATDEIMGNNDGATHPRTSLEEGIADATPAATPAAGSSRSIADAIIAAGEKHAALLRDLVEQFSSSRQVHMP